MSEIPKIEEPVVAPTETFVPATVDEATPITHITEPNVEAPAATELAAGETAAAEPVKEEVKPVEEGILGYKGPGLLKSFIFQKKFFWFGSEPVETKSLTSYLRGEKNQDLANQNAAWSSHTGKGLFYFSKKSAEKATPSGLFNLSEVSDIIEEGTVDFAFTSGGHKHTFQASSTTERDNWVAQLKLKATESKELASSVTESEKYKESHSALAKPAVPAVAAAVLPKKVADKVEAKEEKKEEKKEIKEEEKELKAEKKEEKKEIKEEKKEEAAEIKAEKEEEKKEAKEEKKAEKSARKDRSVSRKRNSIFGAFLNKKEEKTEAKEETPAVATTEELAAPVEATPALEPTPIVPAEATPAVLETTEATPAIEPTTAAATETRPAHTKRNSIFGTLKQSFNKKPETASVVPAKEAEPVSETAPVIPAVESSEPLAAEVSSPANVPTEVTELPAANSEIKTEPPFVKSDKRKASLPWLSKKEKPATSDEEGAAEKPKSPFAKLRATVKGKSSPKAEKATEKPAETSTPVEETPAAAPVEETPIVNEPEPVVLATTPQVAASA